MDARINARMFSHFRAQNYSAHKGTIVHHEISSSARLSRELYHFHSFVPVPVPRFAGVISSGSVDDIDKVCEGASTNTKEKGAVADKKGKGEKKVDGNPPKVFVPLKSVDFFVDVYVLQNLRFFTQLPQLRTAPDFLPIDTQR